MSSDRSRCHYCQWTLEGTMSRPALPAMPDDLRAALVTVSEKVAGLQEAFDTRHVFYMAGTCVWLFIIADCNMSSGVCTAFVTSWFLIGSQPYCLCTLLQMMWTR